MSFVLDLLLLGTAWSHVLLSPYTKVEESFNLHAAHDVLMYGIGPSNLQNYDHFVFPGAVPRSFVGSVLLSWLSLPVILALRYFDAIATKADLQLCVRLTLATLNAIGLCVLRRNVSKRFGIPTSALFTALTCSQFHLPFWMGRTLSNMYALLPANLALSCILNRMPNTSKPSSASVTSAIALLTFASVVFRAELVLLLGPLVLQGFFRNWISISSVVKTGLVAGLASIALTVSVDSYFWDQWPLWPELYSLYFNVCEGKSTEWGVSPYHSYFSSHIPKLTLTSLPLAILGALVDHRIRSLLVAPLAFVALISCLGHKEWRFIVYVVPVINVAAARGGYWLQRVRSIVGSFCVPLMFACIAANLVLTVALTEASRANYPGGSALQRLNAMPQKSVHVHIDNLAAQTGASLFLQEHAPPHPPYLPDSGQLNWVYNKTEHLEANWKRVACINAFSGFQLRREVGVPKPAAGLQSIWERIPIPEFVYDEKLCILERT